MRSSRKNFSDHGLEVIEGSRGVSRVEGCLIPRLTEMHALIVKGMISVLVSRMTITTYVVRVVVSLKQSMLLYYPNDLVTDKRLE